MGSDRNVIVVPVDFSEQSFTALAQTYNLARLTKADIRILHVIDEDFISHLKHVIFKDENYADQIQSDIQRRLDELAVKIFNEEKITTTVNIRTGKIYEEIIAEANDIEASLIIMGTMGASTVKKKFLGSNTSRVIREAHCPVITIKGSQHRKGCKHIALPLDLTKETKEKVNKAIEMAKLFNSVIHVFSVVNTDDEYLVNKLKRQLSQVQLFIESYDVQCTGEITEGDDIPEGIIQYAQSKDADLIIIMTQSETIITDLFIGTDAQEVINNSEIPVLCIRPMVRKDLTEFVLS